MIGVDKYVLLNSNLCGFSMKKVDHSNMIGGKSWIVKLSLLMLISKCGICLVRLVQNKNEIILD